MPTLSEIRTEESRQEGLQKGIHQGMILGEQEMLIDTLKVKFRQMTAHIVEKIQTVADPTRLKFLHRMVFSIQCILVQLRKKSKSIHLP